MTDQQEASPSPNSAPNSPADQTIFDPQFGQSLDLVKENIKTLKRLFPDIVREGKIDFDRLREILGEEIDTEEEPYSFTWHGKKKAGRFARTPSMGTLRPCQEESVDWENTQNLMIEGDNLEVLKLLQKSYYGKIKMIYIDPPYNTGNDFVYRDDYQAPLPHYLQATGQIDEAGHKTSTNTNTSGRFHTNWLNMIYPRLILARNLLRDDGVIFISIDDNEQANLKKLCDEVFGEENFIAQFVWEKSKKSAPRYVSVTHEYIICYVKNKSYLSENDIEWNVRKEGLDKVYFKHKELLKIYKDNYKEATQLLRQWFSSLSDKDPAKRHEYYNFIDKRGVYMSDNSSLGGGGPNYDVLHPITGKPCKVPSRGWRFTTPEKMQEMIDADLIIFGEDETTVPRVKKYLHETEYEVPYSVFTHSTIGTTQRLRALFDGKEIFDHPKDETILSRLMKAVGVANDLILDFFAGSGTTGEAVMRFNAEHEAKSEESLGGGEERGTFYSRAAA